MIDTTKNFTKYIGSLAKATKLVRSLLEARESLDHTTGVRGRKIFYAKGDQKNFSWYYEPEYKTVQVTYTDGRDLPEEKALPEFFVVWIEGLEPKGGEKLLSLDRNNHEYTTSMTQALRIKCDDIDKVKELLKVQGVSDWAINGAGTFHKVNYAPKGTLFRGL